MHGPADQQQREGTVEDDDHHLVARQQPHDGPAVGLALSTQPFLGPPARVQQADGDQVAQRIQVLHGQAAAFLAGGRRDLAEQAHESPDRQGNQGAGGHDPEAEQRIQGCDVGQGEERNGQRREGRAQVDLAVLGHALRVVGHQGHQLGGGGSARGDGATVSAAAPRPGAGGGVGYRRGGNVGRSGGAHGGTEMGIQQPGPETAFLLAGRPAAEQHLGEGAARGRQGGQPGPRPAGRLHGPSPERFSPGLPDDHEGRSRECRGSDPEGADEPRRAPP